MPTSHLFGVRAWLFVPTARLNGVLQCLFGPLLQLHGGLVSLFLTLSAALSHAELTSAPRKATSGGEKASAAPQRTGAQHKEGAAMADPAAALGSEDDAVALEGSIPSQPAAGRLAPATAGSGNGGSPVQTVASSLGERIWVCLASGERSHMPPLMPNKRWLATARPEVSSRQKNDRQKELSFLPVIFLPDAAFRGEMDSPKLAGTIGSGAAHKRLISAAKAAISPPLK